MCENVGAVNSKDTKLLVAQGGTGGCERTGFCGVKGESRTIVLDLQLIADVGLIGFPNAGKSTFLNVISNAKSKIADYPCKFIFVQSTLFPLFVKHMLFLLTYYVCIFSSYNYKTANRYYKI